MTANQRQKIGFLLLQEKSILNDIAQKNNLSFQEVERWLHDAISVSENKIGSLNLSEIEQTNMRDLAMIGLIIGENIHFAQNRLGMAKTLAANICEGDYGNDLDQIKIIAKRIIDNIEVFLNTLDNASDLATNEPQNSSFNLHVLFHEAIRSRKISSKVKIQLNFNAKNPIISASKNQFKHAILVLLQNSLNAINGEEGLISIVTSDSEGDPQIVEVSISDTGRALSEDYYRNLYSLDKIDRIFSRRQELGLTWVRLFIESYGGKMIISTKTNGDTTLNLYLPREFD